MSTMAKKNQSSFLMNNYMTQKMIRLNTNINDIQEKPSTILDEYSTIRQLSTIDFQKSEWSLQPTRSNSNVNQYIESASQVKFDAWTEDDKSTIKLHEESSSTNENAQFNGNNVVNICSSKWRTCLIGLIIGMLVAGIILAVILAMLLKSASTSTTTSATTLTSTTSTSSTSITDTTITTTTSTASTTTSTTTSTSTTISTTSMTTSSTTSTSTTSTSTTSSTSTTTTAPAAVAQSSMTFFCGCSDFILSLTSITFNTINTTYQWQSSLMGQNIWSNINVPSTVSSYTIASQENSTDYRCLIYVQQPVPLNLISSSVTVATTTYINYCQTREIDCSCCGDDLNDFIVDGVLGTKINDIGTGCSANSYDNRTQQSVSLYENTNYTGQASSEYSGGGEQLTIWIDFNNNFQFESLEQVAYQPLNLTYLTDFLVTIPSSSAGATTGIHRMRATVAYAAIPNACGSSSTYGETHDYTVNILPFTGKLYH